MSGFGGRACVLFVCVCVCVCMCECQMVIMCVGRQFGGRDEVDVGTCLWGLEGVWVVIIYASHANHNSKYYIDSSICNKLFDSPIHN